MSLKAVEFKVIILTWSISFLLLLFLNPVNKHKPWLEPTYHGIVTENDNAVLLDPPLIALDKDAPLRFAGTHVAFLSPKVPTGCEAFHTPHSDRF